MAAIVSRRYIIHYVFDNKFSTTEHTDSQLRYTYIDQNLQLHIINSFQFTLALIQPNNIIVNTTSRDLQLVWIGIKNGAVL